MIKAERRIKDFSSGIKKLGNDSLNYIHKLTHVLFLVEQPPVYPDSGKDDFESKKENHKHEVV